MSRTKTTPPSDDAPAQRPPRKPARDNSRSSRLELTGGVPLPNVHRQQTKVGHNAFEEGPGNAPSRRRRPRKLNRAPDQASSAPKPVLDIIPQPVVSNEIEALKGRVESIEAQLRELLQRAPPKLPRRRQRQRKLGELEVQDEPHEELQRLERELISARKELEHLRTRSVAMTGARSDIASTGLEEENEDVEEIPRISGPLSSPTHRVIAMSGSYRLPIPFSASKAEVRSVQAGINSAQRLARQFLDSNPQYNSVSAERAFGSTTTVTRTGSSQSEWYGGYSMSLSRRDTNSAESNLARSSAPITLQRYHRQSLPSNSQGAITSPPTRRAPPKLEIRSGKSSQHIDLKASRPIHSLSQSSMASLLA